MAQKYKIENITNSNVKTSLPETVQNKFKEIDEKFSGEEQIWNERKNYYDTITDVAKVKAEQNLQDYKTQNLNNIESEYQQDLRNFNSNKTDEKNKLLSQKQGLVDSAEKTKADLKQQALESGWRYSSIYENGLKEIDSNLQKETEMLKEDFNVQQNIYNLKKTLLETEKENALSNFDIAYANKLEKEIQNITKEMQNSEEMPYSLKDIEQQLSDISNQKQTQKAQTLFNYVGSLSKQDALNFLNDEQNSLKNEVGQDWYNSIVNWIKVNK